MKVSAVIPHWNRAGLLRTLLENLRLQTRLFDEVIVVDNGSTDGSAELAERAGARVIRLERNYGFAVAVNRGVAATDADWIAILNNDVTLDPGWLDRLLAASLESRARFRGAVHPAAQGIRDELLDRALTDPAVREVVFTAGGNGAGKRSAGLLGDVVYDTPLNNVEHARRTIERVLAAGKRVQVLYVYRPITAALLGLMDRASTQGRTVAVDTLIKTHTEAAKTAAELYAAYLDDPRVTVRFIDNGGVLPSEGSIALTGKEDYASKRDELYAIVEQQRGKLPAYLLEATSGSRVRSAGERQRAADDHQSHHASRGQAQPGWPEVTAFATGKILTAGNHSVLDGSWDAISRSACAVRIGAGAPDGPEWNESRGISMASLTACLVRRATWMPLDERFGSYLEDVDLGLRFAKAGLEGIYEPAAVAYHQGSSTWGRWNPDTVRLLSRNQVLLAAKHFRGQPQWPILVGQLLWGLVALRHGCGWAWTKGKLAGLRSARTIENDTHDTQGFATFLQETESEIAQRQREPYWRLYFWLASR